MLEGRKLATFSVVRWWPRRRRGALALLALGFIAVAKAGAQDKVRAITDEISYDAGSEVRLKVLFPPAHRLSETPIDLSAMIRYAGENASQSGNAIAIATRFVAKQTGDTTGYRSLWKIPWEARAGRYVVDLVATDAQTHEALLNVPEATSLAVYRKLVKIDRVEVDKTFYTSGDAVACRVSLRNLSNQPLRGLRVEFSDRYWPWIAQTSERAGVDVVTLAEALSLSPREEQNLESTHAALAETVKAPAIHQYAVVVWDHDRKTIYDIAFSRLVILEPPGVDSPKPYPLQYVYPSLDAVRTSVFHHPTPSGFDSPAIEFDSRHTMFPAGAEATAKFTVANPTEKPWKGVTVRARLLGPERKELASHEVAANLSLEPHAAPLDEEAKFSLPAETSGVFRVAVEVSVPSGEVLAQNQLELGVNPLPASVLIFCAHQDDEMAHAGMIRAAVENHIPLHVVYFTSGDAGSCDRYYEHSCGPAEALNFGALRMEEARRALGHLGVPREDIYFLGLPDGGSGQIWFNHIQASDPYLSVLLATDHAPYEGLAHPNLPYARESVVEAAKKLIWKFNPEFVYTGHPDERHVDHRTNNWFVVKALQELRREGYVSSRLRLLTDQSYGPGPQRHAPYQYREYVLNVSGEAMALAQEAGWYYQSQAGNQALGRARTFEQLPRSRVHWEVLDWSEHEGWNEQSQ